MKILFVTSDFYYNQNNNTHLIVKLLPYLIREKSEIHILSSVPETVDTEKFPDFGDYTVHWCKDSSYGLYRNPLTRKLITMKYTRNLVRAIKKLHKEICFDLILTTHYPNRGVSAAIQLSGKYPKMLYLMDPPEFLFKQVKNSFIKKRYFEQYLKKNRTILTTPFIREALTENGLGQYDAKIVETGFPIIEYNPYIPSARDIVMDRAKINLLFCGRMHADIRSPKYFLDIISHLDERFCVYFVGLECDKLTERFEINTKAQIVALPNQPYQTALNAMHDADILINIGNSVPVHMPSKTLEYINTGKPIVNFHKKEDCTTLYYTNRYPLCLNLPEYDPDVDAAAEKFVKFCVENKGKTIDTSGLAEEFRDCTPEYIANVILEHLGANND